MSEWQARRFWDAAEAVASEGGGFEVRLDGRVPRTPARALLQVPTLALAEALAEEWQAQGETIDPAAMPMTRMANSAIDKVRAQRAAVEAMLAEYADTDLICYRAEGPEALVARQSAGWDPLLDWAARLHGARLVPVPGVMHRPQDPGALAALAAALAGFDDFPLAALHDLVTLSGSLVIGLAVAEGVSGPEELWERACIDERWQIEQWGSDAEAAARAAGRRAAFLQAATFHALSS